MIKQHQDVTKRRKKKFSRSHNRKRTIRKEIMGNNTLQQKEVYRGLHKFPGTRKHRYDILPVFKIFIIRRQIFQ